MSYPTFDQRRENPDTVRAGLKWTDEENDKLMKEIMEGKDLYEVAKNHQRTQNAVKSRVINNAIVMMNEQDMTPEEVSGIVHISVDEINFVMKRNEDKQKNPIGEIMNVLKEMRDYLKLIAESAS
jgi:hypothetical protein